LQICTPCAGYAIVARNSATADNAAGRGSGAGLLA